MDPIYLMASIGGALALFVAVLYFVRSRRQGRVSQAQPWTLGLEKTHQNFMARLQPLLKGQNKIEDRLLTQLEEVLISADMGVATTQKLLQGLQDDVLLSGQSEIHLLKEYLGEEIYKILHGPSEDFEPPQTPHVMMIVGVNGVGKTTTIGKLAQHYVTEGNQVLLAAADTFRAGAVNQLKVWGDRVGVHTLAPKEGSDPAAVAFDAVKSGVARKMDRVLIDTAGRLHTKVGLMEELKKIKRVIDKAHPGAPHEIWLVIDATQGQNALEQAKKFNEALGLTGIILSKLDSSSKGGMAVGITDQLHVPITYVGLGEKIEDLRPFQAREFVDALMA